MRTGHLHCFHIIESALNIELTCKSQQKKNDIIGVLASSIELGLFITVLAYEIRRKLPQIDYSYNFLLLYILVRNQMSLIYCQTSYNESVHRFDRFIAQIPQQLINNSIKNKPALMKNQQVLNPIEARKILISLVEKKQVLGWRKNWKTDETSYLLFLIDKYCLFHSCKYEQLQYTDWIYISLLIPNKEASACQFKYLSLFSKPLSNVPWSSQQRQLLHRIIQSQNSNRLNWKLISQRLYQQSSQKTYRTGKQCRQQYNCFLRPDLKKGSWTQKQDYILISLFLKIGKKWSKMSKFIDGRNQNSIKNRFFLLFASKRNIKVKKSDLTKIARRRKLKIEKNIDVSQINIHIQEQHLLSSTHHDFSNFELQHSNEEIDQTPKIPSESSLIFNQLNGQHNQLKIIKIQTSVFDQSEEFQRYINF